jgi:hypothetical protein
VEWVSVALGIALVVILLDTSPNLGAMLLVLVVLLLLNAPAFQRAFAAQGVSRT